MTRVARGVALAFVLAALPAQEEFDREALWKKVEKGEPLIELKWRRDAKGSFEYSIAADKTPEWQPWFGEQLVDVVGSTGFVGFAAPLVNSTDLVGLTDAERHLRRFGVSLSTGDLAVFVHTSVPAALGTTAIFDRLLAIDVLRTRTDAETKLVLAKLADDASLPKEIRERAAGVVRRGKLDPATWALPAAPDLVVVLRPRHFPSARYLIDLGRFASYAASTAVLTLLKQPLTKDFLAGEIESDATSEFPFEVARRLGNHRFDEIGFAMCLAADGGRPDYSACVVGAFDIAGVVAFAPTLRMECVRDGDATKLALGDALAGRLAATRLDFGSNGLATAPRPELAKQLLANADAAFVAHAPEGSRLLQMLEQLGLPGVQRADVAVTLREADVLFDVRLGARDAAGANALATAIKDKLKELGWVGAAAMLAITLDESLLRVEPEDSTVHVALPLPRAAIPSLEQAKAHVLKQMRDR